MIRLVIFDLDGTLVNAYRAVASSINHTLRKMGLLPRSYTQIRRSVGFGDKHLLKGFVGEKRAEQAIRIYRAHHGKALSEKGGVTFLPGAKALLPYLRRQGIVLAIATNRPARFTAIILKTLGMKGFFDSVLCADKAPRPKPYPDMLHIIKERYRFPTKEVLFVGDMDIDINTGRRARVRTVAVATGSCTHQELKTLQPYRVIAKIAELKNIIKESGNE